MKFKFHHTIPQHRNKKTWLITALLPLAFLAISNANAKPMLIEEISQESKECTYILSQAVHLNTLPPINSMAWINGSLYQCKGLLLNLKFTKMEDIPECRNSDELIEKGETTVISCNGVVNGLLLIQAENKVPDYSHVFGGEK